MEKGNFGHKEGLESKGKRITEKQSLTPAALLKKLQMDGVRDWKAVEKHKWLKPFAWIRQFIYYAKYVVKYRRHIMEDVRIGNERAGMIEQLLGGHKSAGK